VIEFGPGSVLTGLVKRINANVATFNVNSADSLKNF
jgi:malonyl CoA-acyl carrier protein transacylase